MYLVLPAKIQDAPRITNQCTEGIIEFMYQYVNAFLGEIQGSLIQNPQILTI